MAEQQFEYDVFLSYSSKDKKIVHALAKRLKKDGLRVWLDAWVIQPGDPIGLKIVHGVEKTRTLLLCMSPAYFKSEWGKLESHSILFRGPILGPKLQPECGAGSSSGAAAVPLRPGADQRVHRRKRSLLW